MLENLSPAAIETISQIVLGVIVLLASLLGIRIGVNRGKKSEDEPEALHEIKGAIISDRKAGEILNAMEEVKDSNHELTKAIHELCSTIVSLREAVRDAKQEFRDGLREFRYDLREIKR